MRIIERAAQDIAGGRRVLLSIEDRETLPAILLTPVTPNPVPAALLLHGFRSRKERMADAIGVALLRHGVASLAVDLPLHGERGTDDQVSARNPFEALQRYRLAIAEARLGLQFLEQHPAVDRRRIALVGYSLGAFLGVTVAAEDPLVRVVVLAAGGDLPTRLPFVQVVRTIVDPIRAVRAIAGRPLLMVNGRLDRTATADQAQRLFDAAHEPKQLRWYAGGHWPPANEIEAAAEWLAQRLESTSHRTADSG